MTPYDYFFHGIGILGAICVVMAYWSLLHRGWDKDGFVYNGTNLTGGILLMISLLWNWNTGSALIEVFWIGIAAIALLKANDNAADKEKGDRFNSRFDGWLLKNYPGFMMLPAEEIDELRKCASLVDLMLKHDFGLVAISSILNSRSERVQILPELAKTCFNSAVTQYQYLSSVDCIAEVMATEDHTRVVVTKRGMRVLRLARLAHPETSGRGLI